MQTYSVIIRDNSHQQLFDHLIRKDGQEDLCFATYVPSTGDCRSTAILSEIIFPEKGERNVHGNVAFLPCYFERALEIAGRNKHGLMLLHSHHASGWQGMSEDDVSAESRIAPAIFGTTGLPLVGLTLGTDGSWSGRHWVKVPLRQRIFSREWCDTVRVLGKQLTITFNDALIFPSFDSSKQLRTISAWGNATQENISRLRIGVVGLGSVGSIVAEILARTGIAHFTLIDFDTVEAKNLDRLTNVFESDIGRAKVRAISDGIKRSASSPNVIIDTHEYSICEKEGYEAALNCDVLISCVDRPWPRQVLNFIAYAHLIPVIDGGILVRTNGQNTILKGADWKAHTVGFKRACLECIGQYKSENATLEMSGKMDDPEYIKGLDKSVFVDAHENVFVFSSHLASLEVLQLLTLFIAPSGIADVGQQMHHFVLGTMDVNKSLTCHENCFFQGVVGMGDFAGVKVYGQHGTASNIRSTRISTENKIKKDMLFSIRGTLARLKRWVANFFRK